MAALPVRRLGLGGAPEAPAHFGMVAAVHREPMWRSDTGEKVWNTGSMARTATTMVLDDRVLAGVRAQAARSGRAESEVIEEALRRYLADEGDGLEEIVRRIQARGDLDEDDSLRLAYSELRAMRVERDAQQAS